MSFGSSLRSLATRSSRTCIVSSWSYKRCCSSCLHAIAHVQGESEKSSPLRVFWHFFPNGWKFLVQILCAYYTFLSTLDYKILFIYLQLWQSYAIRSATTIICSKCPPSAETHAGWSHLVWRNFVTVVDNLKTLGNSSEFLLTKKVGTFPASKQGCRGAGTRGMPSPRFLLKST